MTKKKQVVIPPPDRIQPTDRELIEYVGQAIECWKMLHGKHVPSCVLELLFRFGEQVKFKEEQMALARKAFFDGR